MAEITVVRALTNYFNVGDGKRPVTEWNAELKAFTPDERRAFAAEVCAVTGDTLK